MEVLIVDDHTFIHESIAAVVRKAVPGAAVHVASSLAEALSLARGRAELGLALLDLGLPGCSGIEALVKFRAEQPKLRVAVVSGMEDADCVRAVYVAGAAGFIPKAMPPLMMVSTVRLIAEGGTWFPPELIATRAPETPGVALTDRQAAVLRLIVSGLGNQQIAKKLDISENTVKQHTHALYGALKVSSRTQAVAAAARLGIKPD